MAILRCLSTEDSTAAMQHSFSWPAASRPLRSPAQQAARPGHRSQLLPIVQCRRSVRTLVRAAPLAQSWPPLPPPARLPPRPLVETCPCTVQGLQVRAAVVPAAAGRRRRRRRGGTSGAAGGPSAAAGGGAAAAAGWCAAASIQQCSSRGCGSAAGGGAAAQAAALPSHPRRPAAARAAAAATSRVRSRR